MANSVSFLHLADLHIGLRLSRFDRGVADKLSEGRFQALDKALQAAHENHVDFIVIAGDLFDDNDISQSEGRRVFDNLKGKSTPVYILPGNHDPWRPGSVWHRTPWKDWTKTAIRVLTERRPEPFGKGVILFPCPVTQKSSSLDPTSWIDPESFDQDAICIGLAHGSVKDRDNLPADDHLIALDSAEAHSLDYLALGHWHSPKMFKDRKGTIRMAYSGTHEQMNFGIPKFSTGWEPYCSQPEREEFRGGTMGNALLVKIVKDGKISEVKIQELNVGQYIWEWEEHEDVDDQKFGKLFSEIARRKDTLSRLLHLVLKGLLSGESLNKLEEDLPGMVRRYTDFKLERDELYLKPDDQELESAAREGVMRQLLGRLKEQKEMVGGTEEGKVMEAALLVLYRLIKENKS